MCFYTLDSRGDTWLKRCETVDGQTFYQVSNENPSSDREDFKSFCKARECEKEPFVLQVVNLPGYPEQELHCLSVSNSREIDCVSSESPFRFEHDICLVCKEKKTLFVQPSEYNNNNKHYQSKGLFFEVFENRIDAAENQNIFEETPVLVKSSIPCRREYLVGQRLVLSADDKRLGDAEKELLDFQLYVDDKTGKSYLISKEIDKPSLLENSFLNKLFVFSLLKIRDSTPSHPHSFTKVFVGWDLIVFPFLCFVHGIASLPVGSIDARIIHLIQSSGYGKTRLCIELLKYEMRGVYCVYRESGDRGYPSTTSWLQELISAFMMSTSDKESVNICLNFIDWCLQTFSSHAEPRFNGRTKLAFYPTIEIFLGNLKHQLNPSISGRRDRKTLVEAIKSKTNDQTFTIVIDECQAFSRKPPKNIHLMTLYRAFRCAMNEIKACKVVAVFVGSKSTLGDVVVAGKLRPSNRESAPLPNEVFDVPGYIFTHSCNSMLTSAYQVDFDSVSSTKLIGGKEIPCSNVLREIALDCGRPLWRQCETFAKAWEVARTKLTSDDEFKELSSLILRTGSSVVPQDQMAHRLVLSGLATLIYVNNDGSRCFIEYVPEPMISNNARVFLLNISSFRKSLSEYVKRFQLGVLHETGMAGEVVGRIVLLRILDLVCLHRTTRYFADSSTTENAIRIYQASDLIGPRSLNASRLFAQRLHVIRGMAPFSKTATADQDFDSNEFSFWVPTMPVVTVRQFLLMASNGNFDESLSLLGVSDQVLDGLLCFSQFVKTDRPLHIDQVYLMQSFARGCALILPDGTCGADLVIPILRNDNRMSFIAVQIKNYNVDTFPADHLSVSSKLTSNYLSFINLEAVGDFQAAPADDFVRLVIQFGPEDDGCDDLVALTRIPHSTSHSLATEIDVAAWNGLGSPSHKSCNALWLRGLSAFSHLFFEDAEVLGHLNTILSGRRDFYKNLDYSRFPMPTYLQTTEQGARLLGQLARPLANYSNLIPCDAQMRLEANQPELGILRKNIELMQLPSICLDYLKTAKLSPSAAGTTSIGTSNDAALHVSRTSNTLSKSHQAILEDIRFISWTENNLTKVSNYQSDLNNYNQIVNANFIPAIEEKFEKTKRTSSEAAKDAVKYNEHMMQQIMKFQKESDAPTSQTSSRKARAAAQKAHKKIEKLEKKPQ